MAERIRSAIYVDFDNIFSGLLELDRDAALAFASDVQQWLARWLEYGLPDGTRRKFLVQKAYLNPNGWVKDPELGNSSGHLYLQRFRPNLMRAGFEVVDCPSLTSRQKNAADIRLVIDVMLALERNIPCDEVVVASSDSDFTPLLQLLRSRGLRVVILSAGETSVAYRAVADQVIDAEEFIHLLRGTNEPIDGGSNPSLQTAPQAETRALEPMDEMAADVAKERVSKRLAESPGPILISQMGGSLLHEFGQRIAETNWFGRGSLDAFLEAVPDEKVEVFDCCPARMGRTLPPFGGRT